jgi:hypothetical protein
MSRMPGIHDQVASQVITWPSGRAPRWRAYSDHLAANVEIDNDSPAAQKSHPMGFSGLRAAISAPISANAARDSTQIAPDQSTSKDPTIHAKVNVPMTSATVSPHADQASAVRPRRFTAVSMPTSCSPGPEVERVLARGPRVSPWAARRPPISADGTEG